MFPVEYAFKAEQSATPAALGRMAAGSRKPPLEPCGRGGGARAMLCISETSPTVVRMLNGAKGGRGVRNSLDDVRSRQENVPCSKPILAGVGESWEVGDKRKCGRSNGDWRDGCAGWQVVYRRRKAGQRARRKRQRAWR